VPYLGVWGFGTRTRSRDRLPAELERGAYRGPEASSLRDPWVERESHSEVERSKVHGTKEGFPSSVLAGILASCRIAVGDYRAESGKEREGKGVRYGG